jgi:2-polyprenyl-3-methyl-5-hydroxy-6-metoxy-1,4-benzoquinol methylase
MTLLCQNCNKFLQFRTVYKQVRSIYSKNILQEYEINECLICSYRWTSPVPTEKELQKLYGSEYAYDVHVSLGQELKVRAKIQAKFIMKKQRLHDFPILEVGCGSGILLSEIAKSGRRVYGTEISQKMLEIARIRLAKYSQSDNLWCQSAEKTFSDFNFVDFDFMLIHTLEHILEPKLVLQNIAKNMSQDSSLYLIVPNSENIFGRVRNRYWGYWQVPIHVSHYSLKSLKILLDQIGLEVVESRKLGSSLSARILTIVNLMNTPPPQLQRNWENKEFIVEGFCGFFRFMGLFLSIRNRRVIYPSKKIFKFAHLELGELI